MLPTQPRVDVSSDMRSPSIDEVCHNLVLDISNNFKEKFKGCNIIQINHTLMHELATRCINYIEQKICLDKAELLRDEQLYNYLYKCLYEFDAVFPNISFIMDNWNGDLSNSFDSGYFQPKSFVRFINHLLNYLNRNIDTVEYINLAEFCQRAPEEFHLNQLG